MPERSAPSRTIMRPCPSQLMSYSKEYHSNSLSLAPAGTQPLQEGAPGDLWEVRVPQDCARPIHGGGPQGSRSHGGRD